SRGGDARGRKVKGTIHWVSASHAVDAEVRLYDHLFAVPKPDEVEDWQSSLNRNSLEVLAGARLEPSLVSGTAAPAAPFHPPRPPRATRPGAGAPSARTPVPGRRAAWSSTVRSACATRGPRSSGERAEDSARSSQCAPTGPRALARLKRNTVGMQHRDTRARM